MLEVKGVTVAYGKHRALEDVSLTVRPGEIVVILGANGAGKSTLLKAIAGICEGRVSGTVTLEGEPLLGLPPHRVVERGVALVPEGRGIFGDLTVRENLTLGANPARARNDQEANMERLLRLFPKLGERRGQVARTMSGGEQQMVAIGRAMMSNPRILMLDEPSLGLSPLLCRELFQNLRDVRKAGLGILLVEQNAKQSLAIADRGYLLENARIVHEDTAEALIRDPAVQAAYLGAGGSATGATATKPEKQPTETVPDAAPPAAAPLRPRPAPARQVPAGDLVGMDISALVSRAAERTREHLGEARRGAAEREGLTGDRLRASLAEIERAAANARKRARLAEYPLPPLRERAAAPTRPRAPAPVEGPPPVVEVYRAPRVEVYRRRPGSDEFEPKQER